MKQIVSFITLINLVFLTSCSNETKVSDKFQLKAGASINIQTDIQSKYKYSGLYFTLRGIPNTKKDRDFTDFIDLELIDEQGRTYRPEKIWDINGGKRDIVASFHDLPKRVRLKSIKISALQDLDVAGIRWWTGILK